MDTFEGNRQDPSSLHKYLYCHSDSVNFSDPNGKFEGLVGLMVTTAIRASLGAFTGAVVGGTIGGIDAALSSDPYTSVWDGIENGAASGLVIGGLLPFASPAVLTGVGYVGTGLGVVGTIESASEGNYAQAAFRGVMTAGGAGGFKLLNFMKSQYRLQLMEILRVRGRALSLSTDAEKGGAFNYLQGLGLARLEQAMRVTVSLTTELGLDGVAPGLGKIQLKGPFLKASDLSLLSASQRAQAISSVANSAKLNTAYDTFVVDTLGLTPAEIQQLEAALSGLTRRVILLK